MGARRARDDEVARWREHGWVLLEGLVPVEEIDAAAADLYVLFPTAEEYHADPEGETERRLGRPAPVDEFPWPRRARASDTISIAGWARSRSPAPGPSTDSSSIRRSSTSRLVPSAAPTSACTRRRCRPSTPASPTTSSPCTPTGTTRGSRRWGRRRGGTSRASSISPTSGPATAPTHLVSVLESAGRRTTVPLVMPDRDPALYAAEQGAAGVRGSYLAYRLRRLSSGRRPHRARRRPVPPERELQARRPGLGGLPHHAVALDLARLGGLRRGVDTGRVGAVRVPASRAPHLERGAPRRHAAPLPAASTRLPGGPCSRPEAARPPAPCRRRREASAAWILSESTAKIR